MISIGNDIVSLQAVNRQRSIDSRFYFKFITAPELALYQQLTNPVISFESFVWLLWSVKESAYKYFKRHNPELIFSPIKIIIRDFNIPVLPPAIIFEKYQWQGTLKSQSFYQGEVTCGDQLLYYHAIIHPDFVAAVVVENPMPEHVYWGIRRIEDESHQRQFIEVREFLNTKIWELFPQSNPEIVKTEAGYPVILMDGSELQALLSLSHHGHYVAYCFMLT